MLKSKQLCTIKQVILHLQNLALRFNQIQVSRIQLLQEYQAYWNREERRESSGCGAVGRVVAAETRGHGFESSNKQFRYIL